ncbi:MAG: hypothetical protein QW594_03335, partial [Candidatus Woesearchaeota archaeon]
WPIRGRHTLHLPPFTFHLSPSTFHLSPSTFHLSPLSLPPEHHILQQVPKQKKSSEAAVIAFFKSLMAIHPIIDETDGWLLIHKQRDEVTKKPEQ